MPPWHQTLKGLERQTDTTLITVRVDGLARSLSQRVTIRTSPYVRNHFVWYERTVLGPVFAVLGTTPLVISECPILQVHMLCQYDEKSRADHKFRILHISFANPRGHFCLRYWPYPTSAFGSDVLASCTWYHVKR
jgi:hypothetical protein